MSQATTLAQLYAHEDQFSLATAAILQAAGYTDLLTRGGTGRLDGDCTLVKFTRGAALSQHLIPRGAYAGRAEYTRFTGTLTIQRRKKRTDNTPIDITGIDRALGQDMGTLSALLLKIALPYATGSTGALDYLEVSDIEPLEADWGTDERQHVDMITLTWRITYGIKAEAWPSA